jgi:hypothetical protein
MNPRLEKLGGAAEPRDGDGGFCVGQRVRVGEAAKAGERHSAAPCDAPIPGEVSRGPEKATSKLRGSPG